MMTIDTGMFLRIKQAGTHKTLHHMHMQARTSNIHFHGKMISNTGKHLKISDTGIGMRSSPTGSDLTIHLVNVHLDITKTEMAMKGAGTIHKRGRDREIALPRYVTMDTECKCKDYIYFHFL